MAPNSSKSKDQGASGSRASKPFSKLPRIPQGSKIQKRPLPRKQQPKSSKSRLIYVSTTAPFMALVRRVRKRLDKSLQERRPAGKRVPLSARVDAMKEGGGTKGEGAEGAEVVVMGTGKAIEKTLSLATWFSEQSDCSVDVRTRTVGTVDDVVGEDDFEDESRIRKMNCLEVTIQLR